MSFGEEDVDELLKDPTVNKLPLVADAEKAFVKMLNTQYNTIKYKRFPRGSDGLYSAGLDTYTYVINEDLTFETDHETIRGAYVADHTGPRARDMILIKGEEVTVAKYDGSGGGA